MNTPMIVTWLAWLVLAPAVHSQDVIPSDPLHGFAAISEHVRVNIDERIVEFDGFVAIDSHNEVTPDVYLEVIACRVDTREHEALVATHALASQVHAALLAAGFEPGAPGRWERGEPVAPTGQRVRIELIVPEQPELATDPRTWIRSNERDQSLLEWGADQPESRGWVFAGSRMMAIKQLDGGEREVYGADGTGQLIGLHTFGTETIAWARVLSPDAGQLEPEWLADASIVPKIGTPVIVRLSAAEPASEPEASVPASGRPRLEP